MTGMHSAGAAPGAPTDPATPPVGGWAWQGGVGGQAGWGWLGDRNGAVCWLGGGLSTDLKRQQTRRKRLPAARAALPPTSLPNPSMCAPVCTLPHASAGDWIGVVLNRVERTISFTKKGFDLGVAFQGVPPEERLFPSVGFRTPDEEVRRGRLAAAGRRGGAWALVCAVLCCAALL